jgi:hypothetical protein
MTTRRRQDTEPEARLKWERGATWVPATDVADPEDRRFSGYAWMLLLFTFAVATGVQLGFRDCDGTLRPCEAAACR